MPAKLSLVYKLAISVLSLLVFLAVAEIIIRALEIDTYFQSRFFVVNRTLDYPDVFKKDRRLLWRPRAGRMVTSKFFEGFTYKFNSIGLRGGEIDSVKSKPRVLALGNSCTFGWGVKEEETYCSVLQELLDEEFDIMNGGVPGYTSFQGKIFYETEISKLAPDVLLILFAWNDQWAAANKIPDNNQKFPPEIIIDLQNSFSHLHTYRLLKKWILSSLEKHPDSLFSRVNPIARVSPEDFFDNLNSICQYARENGTVPVLLTSPIPSLEKYYIPGSISPLHEHHERYNSATRKLAHQENLHIVDLAAEFDKYEELFDDADYDPIHFNARGHRLAAMLIARKFASLRL